MPHLSPTEIDWPRDVCKLAIQFFSPNTTVRAASAALIGEALAPGDLTPFSTRQFVSYLHKLGVSESWPRSPIIAGLVRQLETHGILIACGDSGGIFGLRYFANNAITTLQWPGHLWLAPILGNQLILSEVMRTVVQVTGKTKVGGDECGGAGLLLGSRYILTAAHVVEDMKLGKTQDVLKTGLPVEVTDVMVDTSSDVAIVVVENGPGRPQIGGLSCRDPAWSDRVTILGYPRVPSATRASLTVSSGEVVHPSLSFFGGFDGFLFSAIARPGNSGGPIFASDGRLVGIVSRETFAPSSEQSGAARNWKNRRQWARRRASPATQQLALTPPVAPFYVGVPTTAIRNSLAGWSLSDLLPLENWT